LKLLFFEFANGVLPFKTRSFKLFLHFQQIFTGQ